MTLELDIDVPGRVSAALEAVPGQTVAVVGPNGAGKSSLLQSIAGTLRPSGTIRLNDAELVGTPPHRRRIAYLQQDALLFPHLNVLDNVAFGPRSHGLSRTASRARAHAELDAVGLGALAESRTAQLSGGQAQRVAIARALAVDPHLILLDEPFAALDASVTPGLRRLVRQRLAAVGAAALLVTHELLDVVTLADRMVVLDGGRIVADDTVERLSATPANQFVADLVGLNLVRGTLTPSGGLGWNGVELLGQGEPFEGTEVRATFSPAAVSLHRTPPRGSPRNVLSATVTAIEPQGPLVEVRLEVADQPIRVHLTPAGVAALDLQSGDLVHAVVKATQVMLFPG